jgi:histone arginine demethylase JMJD6
LIYPLWGIIFDNNTVTHATHTHTHTHTHTCTHTNTHMHTHKLNGFRKVGQAFHSFYIQSRSAHQIRGLALYQWSMTDKMASVGNGRTKNNEPVEEEETEKRKRTWERRTDEAKRKHRPKLKNWSRDGFCFHRKEDFEKLREEKVDFLEVSTANELKKFDWSTSTSSGRNDSSSSQQYVDKMQLVPRIPCNIMSVSQFIDYFEIPEIPVAISGVPMAEGWSAVKNWTFEGLLRYKPFLFKVGEDDKGYKVKMKMKYILQYLKHNVDDSPLYCFDSGYDCTSGTKGILADYSPPSYFPYDLFSLVGEKKRPPYRWFLIGPKRSGTTLHVDPLGTSAWNTSLVGRKRWVLFPPGTPKSVAKGLDVINKGEDDEAINYFVDILPRIKAKHPEVKILELIQGEGDTVFIPGGWWHAVINLDDTIAITQVRRRIACERFFGATYHRLVICRITVLRPILIMFGARPERAVRKCLLSGFAFFEKRVLSWLTEPRSSMRMMAL